MPLYEYECQACGNQLEVQQRMADAPLTTCPQCGKETLQKIISATAFHLKGGGWYKDLYSSNKPGSSDSSTSSSTPAGTKSTSSSDKGDKGGSSSNGSSSNSSGSGSSSGGSSGSSGSSAAAAS